MPKPGTLPRWADLAAPADIVNPPSGKKDSGWLTAEKPAHSYFNWYMNLVYQWTQYLDGLVNEALTWTVAQAFDEGIVVTRTPLAGPAVDVDGWIQATGLGSTYSIQASSGSTGAFFGLAPAAGLASHAAVVGSGVLLAPGVRGLAGNVANAVGVHGDASNASAFGISGTHTAAGGTAIRGQNLLASGFGGHFRADGTVGGAGLKAEAINPAGVALRVEGLLDCINNVRFDPIQALVYSTPKVETIHISVPSFQPGSNAANAAMDNNGRWRSSNVSSYDLASTDVPLPDGVSTSQFEFYISNTDGVSRNFPYSIDKYVYGAGAPTITSIAWGTIVAPAGSAAWYTVPAVTVAPTINGANGGHILVKLQMAATASFSQALFELCRCTYSITNLTRYI